MDSYGEGVAESVNKSMEVATILPRPWQCTKGSAFAELKFGIIIIYSNNGGNESSQK